MTAVKDRKGPAREGEISPVAQNYLLALYMMQDESDDPVTMTRLAEELATSPATEHLGTSLASIAGMVRRMKRAGLIDIKPNKEIVFTKAGESEAQNVMRRHQLAERLLVDILGLDLPKVHAEAHRLEHAISPEVEMRMMKRLGNPQRCPFGHAIPGSGYRPPQSAVPLSRARPGQELVVERIPENDPRLVEYLAENGLLPGAALTVKDVATYRGTVTMNIEGNEVVVGLLVAPRIIVRPKDSAAASPVSAKPEA